MLILRIEELVPIAGRETRKSTYGVYFRSALENRCTLYVSDGDRAAHKVYIVKDQGIARCWDVGLGTVGGNDSLGCVHEHRILEDDGTHGLVFLFAALVTILGKSQKLTYRCIRHIQSNLDILEPKALECVSP